MEQSRECKHLGNPPWTYSGGEYASKWGFSQYRPKANRFRSFIKKGRKRIKNPQGKGWQAQNPEHLHPVLIIFMARFLQRYATPYFAKVLIAGNKTVIYLPKYGGNLHGKRDMFIHHILKKHSRTQISHFILHRQKNWVHNMQPIYAQWWHRVWTIFWGMVQQTFICQI